MSRFQETNALMHMCLALVRLFNFLLIVITTNNSTINIVIMIMTITTLTLLKASHGDCCEDVGSLLCELPRWWDVALQHSK